MLSKALLAAAKAVEPVYVEDVFSTWLYTGNGSTQTITNGIDLAGKGGLVWIKARSSAEIHNLYDTARGANKLLYTNGTAAQLTRTDALTSFTSSGFTLGVDGNFEINTNNTTYASWTFRKAAKFFDVVTYTGNGTNRTIAHNLGSVPGCIIVKNLSQADSWYVYHRSIPISDYLVLNSTAAKATYDLWNNTAPTTSVFSVSGSGNANFSGDSYVAYLFAHDAGGFGDAGTDSVVSCGSYTGNGSATGPIVTLGWEPQWLLFKRTDGNTQWFMHDNMREMSLTNTAYLNAADSAAEALFGSALYRLLPNGFQINTSNLNFNASGGTYIYIAIRRGPMKTPTDATKVFSATAGTNTSPYSVGFPTDLAIIGYRDGNANGLYAQSVGTRLTGNSANLYTSRTAAEDTSQGQTWSFDLQNSFDQNWVSPAARWNFRRAPGFFDVVAYDGGGTSKNHNLGVKPELAFIKVRSTSFRNWIAAVQGGTGGYLNTSDPINVSNLFIDLANATTTTFPVNGNPEVGQSGQTYIAYLFATCPGVSKVGSYTGTGATQQINCGFTAGARFVLIKRTDSTGDWYVWDSARGIIAGNDPYLLLNSTAAEVTNTDFVDTFSAGFEISSTAPAAINANGGSFIFLAVA